MSARVEGTDLATLLAREGPLEPERALLIVRELADALDAARWSRGLVHGRLTPAEVLVAPPADEDSHERVFLPGFGLRRELPPGEGLAEPVTAATDVYALGCLLFTCLTGQPSVGVESLETADARLPPSMRRVIRKALAASPEQRYSTCSDLAAAAEAALAAGGEHPAENQEAERPAQVDPPSPEPADVESTPPPSTTEPRPLVSGSPGLRWLKKREPRSLATVGLVAVLAALAAGVIWLTGRGADVRSAAPALPATQPNAEAAVATVAAEPPPAAEPPAEAEPAVAEPEVVEPAVADPDEPGPFGAEPPKTSLSRLRGSLVRIDAASGEILARIPIPSPKLIAADRRSVWVLSNEVSGGTLVRVEVARDAVAEIFNVAVAGWGTAERLVPHALAAAGGRAWLAADRLYRFAPGARAGARARIDGDSPWYQWPVAAAGSLWVRNGEGGGALLRVDPATERILARFDGPDRVVAAGPGFLWARSWELDTIVRIDTETDEVSPPIGAPDLPWTDFAAVGRSVWASNPEQGAIVRLDSLTGEEKMRVRVRGRPRALAAGAGAVWAAVTDKHRVIRYETASGRLETIDVGGRPADLVFAHGSVWVAVYEVPEELAGNGRQERSVDGVRFSFRVPPDSDWTPGPIERLPDDTFRNGSLYISKDTAGPQNAEAVVFWTSFPDGEHADACPNLLSWLGSMSASDLAPIVAAAPGTALVAGPSDVTVGGRPAKHVVLTVREDAGCDPGYFYTWHDEMWGPFWAGTDAGNTIRVWIVDVAGTLLFIEAETTGSADSDLDQEIQQIVDSIRFD
jgi:hypothetical protein